MRHRSTGSDHQRIGSLFFNPGGPGGSGVSALPEVWRLLPAAVKRRFDLVSWDPRGVGQSNPMINCTFAPEFAMPDTGPVDWDEIYAQMRAGAAKASEECLLLYPDHYPYVGTNQVVRDLDSLRKAVGDAGLTFWGASYGSRIGYVYQLRFPDKVRALLLDGVVNPNGSIQDSSLGYGGGVDNALPLFEQYYPGTIRQIRRITKQASRKPLPLGGGVMYTHWTTSGIVDAYLRRQASWPELSSTLDRVETVFFGKGTKRTTARKWLKEYLKSTGLAGSLTGVTAVPAAVNCLDYADRPTAAEQNATARVMRRQSPVRGWYNYAVFASQCTDFGVPADPVPIDFGMVSSKRVLLSGATRDPATPYAWTQSMARAMKDSRVVTYVGSQHIVYRTTPSQCVNKALTRFLVTVDQPKHDLACDTVLGG
jgi:pimeloyl-ACP methyl ester carboxylesterase